MKMNVFCKQVMALSICFCFAVTGCEKQTVITEPLHPQNERGDNLNANSVKEKTSEKPPKEISKPAPLKYINPLSAEQISAGTINLFDAETLFGWTPQKGKEINWAVQENQIAASEGPIGLLMTKVRYADFELSLDFQLSPGGNSGVFLRCAANPSEPATDCYEINIAQNHPQGYDTGAIVGLQKFKSKKPTVDGKWHSMKIVANQNSLTVLIDGQASTQFKDERKSWLRSGYIGLQKNSGEIAFRNVQLKPLNQTDLFNGKDLSGWREVPGSKSKFEVVNSEIHVINGAGFLETEKTYGNFMLQFEAKTHAAKLNSGLFFRAMQGSEKDPSNGYEVQIHNGFNNEDRNQPENAGTGAIFRRVDARRVVSSDEKWCTITLIADGSQISTWVDGYPVVDWNDERKPDENPRKGKRTEAGHLSLQGHDPTTDLSFRNFKMITLP